MDDPNQLQAAQTFAGAFAESFAESLTLKLGTPWLLKTIDDADILKPVEPTIHFRLSAAGGLQGDCFVAFDQAQVIALGSRLLEQADSALSDPQAEALAEVIVSAMDGVSAFLSAQFGAVNFKVDRVEDVRLEEMLAVPLDASSEDKAETPILLYLTDQLLASLSSTNEGMPSAKPKKTTIDRANLQLVMDVELNVSLRFGQCQLPLRDVLDLTSGSVIELDRDVDDPVELLLDGKVIARGEAVIVDGNYGLRVTEIPEPIASHFVS
jgi:flagellar motor switch protein FliN/FliY